MLEEHRVRDDDDGAGPLRGSRREGVVDFAGVPRLHGLQLYAQCPGRILRVSRTIADLEGAADIKHGHLSEAIGYRSLDRKLWAR